ncbi:hypothetical protein PSE_2657 [Pseudovibrio sp. FO-BEG1]|nr:hypothetical protein PSE_2657 [Pseudovibrio sp. FO-BEG1]
MRNLENVKLRILTWAQRLTDLFIFRQIARTGVRVDREVVAITLAHAHGGVLLAAGRETCRRARLQLQRLVGLHWRCQWLDLLIRAIRTVQINQCLLHFIQTVLHSAGIEFLLSLTIKIAQVLIHLLQGRTELLTLWWTKRPVTAKAGHLTLNIADVHLLLFIGRLPAVGAAIGLDLF